MNEAGYLLLHYSGKLLNGFRQVEDLDDGVELVSCVVKRATRGQKAFGYAFAEVSQCLHFDLVVRITVIHRDGLIKLIASDGADVRFEIT